MSASSTSSIQLQKSHTLTNCQEPFRAVVSLDGREVNTLLELVQLAEFCVKKQNQSTRIVQKIVDIISVVAAIAVGTIASVALSPVACFFAIPAYFMLNGLFSAFAEKVRSLQWENAGQALLSDRNFVQFAERNKISLTRDLILGAHKTFIKNQADAIRHATV